MNVFITMKNHISVIFKDVRRHFGQVHNSNNIDYNILYDPDLNVIVGRTTIQMHIPWMHNGLSNEAYAGTTLTKSHQCVCSGGEHHM